MYEIIDYATTEGIIPAVHITSGTFKDYIFSYGEVKFDMSSNNPILNFEYTLHEGKSTNSLQNIMGDILIELIDDSLVNNTTIFKGGI